MNKKLFVFDMDGTLLNKNSEINPETVKALREVKEKGHEIAIATGRPAIFVKPFKELMELASHFICNNGAYIYWVKEDKYMHDKSVPFQVVKDMLDIAKENKTKFFVHTTSKTYATNLEVVEKTQDIDLGWGHMTSVSSDVILKTVQDKPIMQSTIFLDNPSVIAKLEKEVKSKYTDISIQVADEIYLDFGPQDSNKLSGIEIILPSFGMSMDDVVAFGDSGNDIEMLSGVGKSYAMGNAIKIAVDAAGEQIGNNDSNAIADTLRKIINA